MVVTIRSQPSMFAQLEQNAENVLNQILAAIQGLAQASVNINAFVQKLIERLPGLVARNGTTNFAEVPGST